MLLEPLGDGAAKAVSVGNCCLYFDGFVKQNLLLLLLLLLLLKLFLGCGRCCSTPKVKFI
jgi:hypothetical protein